MHRILFIVNDVGGEDAVTLRPEFAPIFDTKDMINLGIGEFYIKTTIDGESYDPFSAESLKVLPAPYPSNRLKIFAASRNKYAISAADAKRLIDEEESTIIRSAQEKAAITRVARTDNGEVVPAQVAEAAYEETAEPLI